MDSNEASARKFEAVTRCLQRWCVFLPATIFATRICNPIFISQIEFATQAGDLDSNSGKSGTALRKHLVTVFALLVMSATGMAQLPTSGNVYFGYSYFHGNTGVSNTGSLNGWEATLEGKTFPHVGIVADLGGEYGKLGYPVLEENVTTHIVSILLGRDSRFRWASSGPLRNFCLEPHT